MLHETGIFTTTIYRKFKPNVGRYSSLMEHTSLVWERLKPRRVKQTWDPWIDGRNPWEFRRGNAAMPFVVFDRGRHDFRYVDSDSF